MKVYVDISVFTDDAAIGRVSGTTEVPIVPVIGDIMNFGASKEGHIEEPLVLGAHLKVTNRMIVADSAAEIMITLSDLTLGTEQEALKAMAYLEQRYGLITDVWDNDEGPRVPGDKEE